MKTGEGEFGLIARHFVRGERGRRANARVVLGIGDDCALLAPAPGHRLAISTDMLVEGRHFLPNVDAAHLGHKALAVNLSDLAASGARPLAFTLALALPDVDDAWLGAFADGLFALADAHDCTLIGGDTTRGPLNICITVFGEVPPDAALLRSGAKPGDDVWVSGHLGDAWLGLQARLGRLELPGPMLACALDRLERPTPRVALGLALRGLASAAMDVSDGLLGDLAHILSASGVGATIDTDIAIDLIACCAYPAGAIRPFDLQTARRAALSGGDDYELLFCTSPADRDAVAQAAHAADTPVTRIGTVDASPGLRLIDTDGHGLAHNFDSFDHFSP